MKALVLITLLMVSGCAAVPVPCPAPVYPPSVYLQDVPAPAFTGRTNAALAEHVLDLRRALEQSNADKARLREFYANHSD
ncbi:MAG: hypothetical protein LBR80_08865 [Deltaproteobacteria bacterium]|jgi:hypothetical protein|nr:hypothetical protein [Deltaproteobacteria bacterium]